MARPCSRCGERPGHAMLRWGIVAAAWAALEAEAVGHDRHRHTFSFATRRLFRTHTPEGRRAFTVGWMVLTVWFLRHILSHESNHRP